MNATRQTVLVVDDEENIRDSIKRALERTGYAVHVAGDARSALARMEQTAVDLVLCDIRLPEADGLNVLGWIREHHPQTPVVMMTGYASIESAVEAIQHGAADYLAKPFSPEQVRLVVAKALEQRRLKDENLFLRQQIDQAADEGRCIGESAVMARVFDAARMAAGSSSSVLLTGESGVGKEVLARYIHAQSPRRERPFVNVNCAAIPAPLLESELFGHRRGAFTGATYDRRGSFELADGGTLFLDEIGEMPVEMQAKILQALENRTVKAVGAEQAIAVDVRIISATNRDLEAEMKAGRFRQDIYWRLNVVQIAVPPLREHRDDVAPLARHFLAVAARDQKKAVPDLSAGAIEALTLYDWPGNVRELRNAIERAVIFADAAGEPVRLGHLPPHIRQRGTAPTGPLVTLREMESQYILQVIDACAGNRSRAAEILGVSPVTLWRRLGKETGRGSPGPSKE